MVAVAPVAFVTLKTMAFIAVLRHKVAVLTDPDARVISAIAPGLVLTGATQPLLRYAGVPLALKLTLAPSAFARLARL
ncbi:hypothetical protein D3C72_926130 [compost metagenome]